jgi:hypothetical protein
MTENFLQSAEDIWPQHSAALRQALETTIRDLDRLIRVDEYHRHGYDPHHLNEALGPLGSANLNLSELSLILGEGTRTRTIRPERLERVLDLLKTLAEIKEHQVAELPPCATIDFSEDETAIHELAVKHLDRMAAIFRALRIAQLEIRSKYDPSVHDAVFADFDWRQLNHSELQLCPPFLVIARMNGDPGSHLCKMASLLESRKPLKIVILRHSLRRDYSPTSDASVPASMAIETLPIAMRGVFFLQTCPAASNFAERIVRGLTSPRPGVISLLHPKEQEDEQVFLLRAERAMKSRAFPICLYDPDSASRFVSCFDLSANPSPDEFWISKTFSIEDDSGVTKKFSESYTFAHFAAEEPEFSSEFEDPAPGLTDDELTPLANYLELSRRQRLGRYPYVTLGGSGGPIRRKVVSMAILTQTVDQIHLWKTLQEISGIENPYINTTRTALQKEFGTQQKILLESLQRDLEVTASHREKVAVADAVRRLVAHLTGVDTASIDLRQMFPPGGDKKAAAN